MAVDQDTVRRIARLARIGVDENALEPMAKELSTILEFVEQLSELDTKDVEPMTNAVQLALKQRDDVVNDGNFSETILRNAPAQEGGFFVVPKVVE